MHVYNRNIANNIFTIVIKRVEMPTLFRNKKVINCKHSICMRFFVFKLNYYILKVYIVVNFKKYKSLYTFKTNATILRMYNTEPNYATIPASVNSETLQQTQ